MSDDIILATVGGGGASGASDNTGATIHLTTAGTYTDSPAVGVSGTASGLGFDAVDTYDNGVLDGGSGVYNGVWTSTVSLTPGDNVITAGPELGSGAASDNAIDLVYEPGFGNRVNVTVAQAGGNTNSAAQTLSGTATSTGFGARLTAGTVLTLSDDGAVVGHAAVAADGTWSAQVALTSLGSNMVTVADTDLAGNTGEEDVLFGLKTTVPAVAITSAGGLVNQAVQTISGTATAGDVGDAITVVEDGTAIGTAAVGTDGSWALTTTLAAGSHAFQATDADQYGNVGVSNTVVDTLNTTPVAGATPPTSVPNAPSATPPTVAFGPAPQLSGTTATLSGTASDAVGVTGVEIFQGTTALGAAQVDADGTWTFSHDFGQGNYDHLTAVATDPAGLSATAFAAYDLVTGLPGKRYTGEVETLAADGTVASATTIATDGSIGAQTVANGDGTATSTGYENGQALFSIGNDVMTGNGYRENFVFQPTMGHARVTDFVVDGPGHDTITLSHQDFDNVAQVLNRTTMSHGSALIHVSPTDTIRLAGVTRADLDQHRGDFAFTS